MTTMSFETILRAQKRPRRDLNTMKTRKKTRAQQQSHRQQQQQQQQQQQKVTKQLKRGS